MTQKTHRRSRREANSEARREARSGTRSGTRSGACLVAALFLAGVAVPAHAQNSGQAQQQAFPQAQVLALASAMQNDEVRGNTPESQKGYDISLRSDRTDRGYGDSRVDARMVLRNRAGQETAREFSFATLEKEDETVGDKSLVIFRTPRDVEGTALLSHAKILDPDDQWLFLPALKRVKRISSANKSGSFVGSEFAFEDFTITELNKFTYAYLREEERDGLMVDVIERFPRYEKSGYTRQVVYIDQDIFQTRAVEFYDRKGALLKTLTLKDYREYDGVWRAQTLTMTNHQTGKETDLVYDTYAFKTGLDAGDFEQGVLRRLR